MRRLTAAFLLTILTSSLTVALAGSAQAAPGCIERSGNASWGAGQIRVCAGGGQGSYSGYTTDKDGDGHCVRWRIDWDNKPDSHTPWACPKGTTTNFNVEAPAGVSGVSNAYLERVKV
ncbi:MAG TPA: hypothetical protein VK887_12260 [Pseudonocardiaceae bacterium]|jgi:hypothetical protein|nr:hypothetical protein [Pseudonocardiaceae bacterium]